MFRKTKGFTLIELLIVMAVIAILIAIAIPSFRGMQDSAKTAKAQGDIRVLKLAVEAYYAKNDAYPTSEATYQAALLGGTPRVIEAELKDVFDTANVYKYLLSSNGRYYAIWSKGVNVTSGTVAVPDTGVVTESDTDDIGTTNGTNPNTNWK